MFVTGPTRDSHARIAPHMHLTQVLGLLASGTFPTTRAPSHSGPYRLFPHVG